MRWTHLKERDMLARAEALGRLAHAGTTVLLDGPMGAGKTTFTRALGRGLGLNRPDRVCSPTFNLCVMHPGPIPLIHIDLCRLVLEGGGAGEPASFEALDVEQLLEGAGEIGDGICVEQAVVAIEWASSWPDSRGALRVCFSRPNLEVRDLQLCATGTVHTRLLERWTNVCE